MPVSSLDARTRVFSFAQAKNTTVAFKIKEAILAIDNGSKGASVSAIVTWILSNYSIMDPNQLKLKVKKSVVKLLENGDLRRGSSSKGAQGSSGSFILPKIDVGSSKKTKSILSKSTTALEEKETSKDTKTNMRKSVASKANTLRVSKKFPKIREIGIKADKFSASEFLKLLEK